MESKVLKRVFMSNGIPLTDPDPAMSPAAVKDFWSAMYPELLNAEVQGPVTSDTELTFTFHRTTGTKGRGSKTVAAPAKSAPKSNSSFMQRLEIAAGEASKVVSKTLPPSKLTQLYQLMQPARSDKALQLPSLNCPLLI